MLSFIFKPQLKSGQEMKVDVYNSNVKTVQSWKRNREARFERRRWRRRKRCEKSAFEKFCAIGSEKKAKAFCCRLLFSDTHRLLNKQVNKYVFVCDF